MTQDSQVVTQIIGRYSYPINDIWRAEVDAELPSYDGTRPDYKFWDRFRRGKASGYDISALIANAAANTYASWVLGRGVGASLAVMPEESPRKQTYWEYTNDLLEAFFKSIQPLLYNLYVDLLCLGDQYIVVNADGTLTPVPPNRVYFELDPRDYRDVTAVIIRTVLDEYTIEDRYTAKERTITIKNGKTGRESTARYKNLIGRIPVVHFANNRSPDELYGRPLFEPLLGAFKEIDQLIQKASSGAKVAGNPIPVFSGIGNISRFIQTYKDTNETYEDSSGTISTREKLKFDKDQAIILGLNENFAFASPDVGFSEDINRTLRLLIMRVQDGLSMPSFLWGGGEPYTKSGAEAYMPAWLRYVEGRRDQFAGLGNNESTGSVAQGGLYELADIWLQTMQLSDYKVLWSPVVLSWPVLTESDARTQFEQIKWLHSRGAISTLESLKLLNLVSNPEASYQEAQDEIAAGKLLEPDSFDDYSGENLDKTADDGSPDRRKRSGASAPRNPSYGGGGKVTK